MPTAIQEQQIKVLKNENLNYKKFLVKSQTNLDDQKKMQARLLVIVENLKTSLHELPELLNEIESLKNEINVLQKHIDDYMLEKKELEDNIIANQIEIKRLQDIEKERHDKEDKERKLDEEMDNFIKPLFKMAFPTRPVQINDLCASKYILPLFEQKFCGKADLSKLKAKVYSYEGEMVGALEDDLAIAKVFENAKEVDYTKACGMFGYLYLG